MKAALVGLVAAITAVSTATASHAIQLKVCSQERCAAAPWGMLAVLALLLLLLGFC